jgi:WD40 repeat protein
LLETLASRPDTRQCRLFRAFIDFDKQTESPETLRELVRGRCVVDPRFGVIGLSIIGDVLVVVHTDTTSLARLGKVWTIIEPDELGTLSLWRIARGSGITQSPTPSEFEDDVLKLGDKVFTGALCETAHCIKLSIESTTLAIGLANGCVQVYDIQSPMKPEWVIKAHGSSPVIAVDILNDTVVSVGLDNALRLSSTKTGKMISGGQLSKRLVSGEIFTCMNIHVKSERVFIGSNKGRIFVYSINSGSPQFELTMQMNSYPVSSISSSEDQLFVGFDCSVSVYEIGTISDSKPLFTLHTLNGQKVTTCIPIPKTSFFAVGLSDGSVSIYFKSILVYSRFFAVEKINSLYYSQPDGVLWIGGDDGRVVEAILPSTIMDDAKYAEDCAVTRMAAQVEEFAVPIKTSAVENKAPNNPPPKVKSAALAENDSDDDEWKKGLFSS